MFARVNGLGWGLGVPLQPGEMNQLDIDHANAVDGAGGGLYTPIGLLEFGGSGLKVSGAFLSTANAAFTGTQQFLGTAVCTTSFGFAGGLLTGDNFSDIRWDGIATFRNGAQLIGNAGSTLLWSGSSTFSIGVLTVNSNATFQAPGTATFKNGAVFNTGGALTTAAGVNATFGGNATFNGTASFPGGVTGAVNFAGQVSLTAASFVPSGGTLAYTGTGHAIPRLTFGTDGNMTIGINDCDCLIYKNGVLTANHNLIMTNVGSQRGVSIELANEDSAHGITVYQADGATLIAILQDVAGVAGKFRTIKVMMDDVGIWRATLFSAKPV